MIKIKTSERFRKFFRLKDRSRIRQIFHKVAPTCRNSVRKYPGPKRSPFADLRLQGRLIVFASYSIVAVKGVNFPQILSLSYKNNTKFISKKLDLPKIIVYNKNTKNISTKE